MTTSSTVLDRPPFHEPADGGRPRTPERLRAGIRDVVEEMVAGVFDVPATLLRQPTRGRANVALARQAAMYITHVSYGLSLTDVGELFERDRTTVAHACSVIELRRDDSPFDEAIQLIDLVIRVIDGTRRNPRVQVSRDRSAARARVA